MRTETRRRPPGRTAGTPKSTAEPHLTRDSRMIIGILLVAAFVVILNETIMGVALPRLMSALAIDATTAQWLSTAFMLTMAVVIPTTGFLLQRLTTRQVFILAMVLFCAGTLLAALASGFWVLLAARIVQASGTAVMVPLLMTTVLTLVPEKRRGAVMGNITIVIAVAPAIGPTISGLILQHLTWRFMFALVLPFALAAMALGARRLVNVGETTRQRLDAVSVVLSVPAFGGLVFGLSRFGVPEAAPLTIAGPLVVAVVCLVAFGVRQVRLQTRGGPLLDLRVFRYRMYRLSTATLMIAMTALFGVIILLPIYLQSIRGLDSLQTGLLLLPGGLTMGLLGPVVGRLFDRFGPTGLTAVGSTLMVLVLLALSQITADTSVWALLGLHVLLSLGLSCLFTPTFTTGLNPLPPQLHSHGSAVLSTLQQLAGAAGTALLVTVMTLRAASLRGSGTSEAVALGEGLQAAFAVAGFIGLGAVALALMLRKPADRDVGGRPAARAATGQRVEA
jgi:MFS transporter, DHA2 family, lincomycin resistance protein